MTDRSGADQRSFAVLASATAACITGLTLLVVHLLRLDAPSHVLGLIKQLCTTASHLTMDVGSLLLAAVPTTVALVFVVSAISITRRTGHIVGAVGADRVSEFPRAAASAAVRAGIPGKLDVIDCPDLLVFACGYLRPRVVLSTAVIDQLTPSELTAVLCHEAHHIRRRDPLRIFLAEVAARSLFLFPVIAELRNHFSVASEIAADQSAIRATSRRSLVGAVVKFADAPDLVGVPAMVSEAGSAERVAHLLDPNRSISGARPTADSLAISGLCVGVLWMFATLLARLPAM